MISSKLGSIENPIFPFLMTFSFCMKLGKTKLIGINKLNKLHALTFIDA